jgi:hypothetical protein
MMELLLARFNAIMKEHKQYILVRIEAYRKAEQAKAEGNQAKGEADREELKGMMNASTKSMREDIKSGQAEMRSITGAIEEKMEAWIANRI